MNNISRKEFLELTGISFASILIPACFGSCKKTNNSGSAASVQNVDFTVSVASGALSKNGGAIFQNGVIVARTNAGAFIAVASACTHQGSTVQYVAGSNSFYCPSHGAGFDSTGKVTNGPASTDLQKFNTTLTGTSLRVYS